MTATERLRQLLDERVVEYETYYDAAFTEVDAVFWQDRNGQPCTAIGNADDIPEMMLSVQCVISPEQAVEATLGRGTCHIVKTWSDSDYVDGWRYRCSECMCFIPVNERNPETGDVISASNYCPNCGRRVES